MVVIVVVVVLMAVLIHGCEVSQSNSSLKDYAVSVDTLMEASGQNGTNLFSDLESGDLSSPTGVQTLQEDLDGVLTKARLEVTQAQGLSAPGELAGAQSALVDVMKLRLAGIGLIANNIQPAASTNTSRAAVAQIARGMYTLSGSDVDYKTLVAPGLAQALNGASIPVGGTTGVQIYGGQILRDLGWLNTLFIGEKTGADLPASVVNHKVKGAVQGHILNSVSVSGTPLDPSGNNEVPASPAPTFTLNFTNGGTTDEYKVECEVTVKGLSDVGTTVISETAPGHTYNCNVTLPQQPTASSYEVTAEIVPVPGESNTKNNFLTYTVDFT